MFWVMITIISHSKDGEYDAPPGMLYMQEKAELEEKEKSFILQDKDYAKESNLFGST